MIGPAGDDRDAYVSPKKEEATLDLLALAIAMGAGIYVKNKTKKKEDKPKQDLFNATLARAVNRLLPGAHMIRGGRPPTGIMARIKKKQRRALKGATLSYKKQAKGFVRALTNQARGASKGAYK